MASISVGKYTYDINLVRVVDYGNQSLKLSIGSFTSIAGGTEIYLADGIGHRPNWTSTYPFGSIHQAVFPAKTDTIRSKGDVVIGSDVWIGEHVSIMHGVTIGDGAVVAVKSHVVKDVEPYSIVGGNPARFLKYRFNKDLIERLLQIKWWDYPDEKIARIVPYLHQDPTHDILDTIESLLAS
jgi:acetyltransferase-like isoleucine patch superfamily enzyme